MGIGGAACGSKIPKLKSKYADGEVALLQPIICGGQDRGNKFIDLPREPFYEPSYGGNTIFLSFIPSTYLGIYLEGLKS